MHDSSKGRVSKDSKAVFNGHAVMVSSKKEPEGALGRGLRQSFYLAGENFKFFDVLEAPFTRHLIPLRFFGLASESAVRLLQIYR